MDADLLNSTGVSEGKSIAVAPIIVAILISVVVAATVLGNALVVVAFLTTRRLRTYNNHFILGLAIADFLVGAIGMPMFGVVLIIGRWPFSETFCDVFSYCDHAFSHISVVSVMIISLDRFVAIVFPFHHRSRWRHRSKALMLVAIAFLVPLITWAPPTLLWNHVYGSSEARENGTSGDCLPDYLESDSFSIVSPVLFFWIPFIVTTLFYIKIFSVIHDVVGREGNVRRSRNWNRGRRRQVKKIHEVPVGESSVYQPKANASPTINVNEIDEQHTASGNGHLIQTSRRFLDRSATQENIVSFPGNVRSDFAFVNCAFEYDSTSRIEHFTLDQRWGSGPSIRTDCAYASFSSDDTHQRNRSFSDPERYRSSGSNSKNKSPSIRFTAELGMELPNVTKDRKSIGLSSEIFTTTNSISKIRDNLGNNRRQFVRDLKEADYMSNTGNLIRTEPTYSNHSSTMTMSLRTPHHNQDIAADNVFPGDTDEMDGIRDGVMTPQPQMGLLHICTCSDCVQNMDAEEPGSTTDMEVSQRSPVERAFKTTQDMETQKSDIQHECKHALQSHNGSKNVVTISNGSLSDPKDVGLSTDRDTPTKLASSLNGNLVDANGKHLQMLARNERAPSRYLSKFRSVKTARIVSYTKRNIYDIANRSIEGDPEHTTEDLGLTGTFTTAPPTSISAPSSIGDVGTLCGEDTQHPQHDELHGMSPDVIQKLAEKRLRSQSKKGIRTLGFIIMAMFITWVPWAVIVIILSLCDDCIPDILYSITVFLGYMNSTANPICYALSDPKFKKAFRRLLRLDCVRSPSAASMAEHSVTSF